MEDAQPPESSEPVAEEPPLVDTAPVSASWVDEPTVAPEEDRAGEAEAAPLQPATPNDSKEADAQACRGSDEEQAQLQILTEMGFDKEAAWEAVCLHGGDTTMQVEWLQQNQITSPDELAGMEFQSVPTSPAATAGGDGGGASMMTKLSATIPSFGLGSGKETMGGTAEALKETMGGTAEALKAKLKDGSSWMGSKLASALPTGEKTAEALHAIKTKGSGASSALRGGFKSLFSTMRDAEAELSRGPPPPLLPVMDSVTGPVGVFGVPLVQLTAHESAAGAVPAMVAACAHTLHCIGLETKGLFTAEGDAGAVRELVEHFEADKGAFVPQGSEALDIAAVLARYLRSLPEPLLTYKLYDKVVVAGHSLPALIRDDLASLPPPHFSTLRLVVGLLSAVAANAESNQMSSLVLGKVFGPLLCWPRQSTDRDAFNDAEPVAAVVTHLIEFYEEIFVRFRPL